MHRESYLIVLILLLCASASAQEFSVRVTYNTNLRASYSLQSDIVATVPAGTTLQVVASHNRWLRVNRGGGSAWLADWVPMTRITGAQSPATIDNCCFIDRQCNSDQEWADGYWAFQNKQCAAPPAQQPASATTHSAAEANNCCQLNWACHSADDWTRGFHAYQSNSCAGGAASPGDIMVEGTAGFKALVSRALDLLSTRAPHWHHYAITNLNAVVEVNPPHGRSGVELNTAVATFNLASPYQPIPDDDMTMAEFLVHEACHVHRFRAGLEPGGYPGEKACIEAEVALWQEVAPNSLHHNRKLRYLAVIHRRECQHWLPPVPGGCT